MFRKEQIWFVHKDDDGDMSIHLLILLHSRKFFEKSVDKKFNAYYNTYCKDEYRLQSSLKGEKRIRRTKLCQSLKKNVEMY